MQISTIAKQVSRITGARVRFAVNASPDSWSYQVDFTKDRPYGADFQPWCKRSLEALRRSREARMTGGCSPRSLRVPATFGCARPSNCPARGALFRRTCGRRQRRTRERSRYRGIQLGHVDNGPP